MANCKHKGCQKQSVERGPGTLCGGHTDRFLKLGDDERSAYASIQLRGDSAEEAARRTGIPEDVLAGRFDMASKTIDGPPEKPEPKKRKGPRPLRLKKKSK